MTIKSIAGIRIEFVTMAAFVLMIVINILANYLPINGVTTGQVSEYYPNLFQPSTTTFAIWGLIYMLLAGYVFYQLGIFKRKINAAEDDFLSKIRVAFIYSSLANTLWIFSWHYFLLPLSMLLIIVIFLCLFYICYTVSKYDFSLEKMVFIRIPFSIYFGWITVATIANFAVLAASLEGNYFGFGETTLTIVLLLFGQIVGMLVTLRYRDIAYGLVFIWAYAGILIKHVSEIGFSGQYHQIIIATSSCIFLTVLVLAYVFFTTKRFTEND